MKCHVPGCYGEATDRTKTGQTLILPVCAYHKMRALDETLREEHFAPLPRRKRQ